MDNRCLVIMPSGDPSGYAQGHFGRVYDYVIVPACRAAGYWPSRIDAATSDKPFDIVKNIVDAEIVLCDLSASNAEALYGLAVRQSLDLPVTLVKDLKSFVLFNASDFDTIEYDESLRIDTVQKAIEVLGEAIKKAVTNKKERHQLLNRLSIGLPQFTPQSTSFEATASETLEPMQEETKKKESKEPKLPIISPLPDYVGDPFTEEQIAKLKAGDTLFHLNHGKGKVDFVKNMGKDRMASIKFESGTKLLVLIASDFFRTIEK